MNLCGGSTTQDTVAKWEPTSERDSWQPKVLALKAPRQDCWLVDSSTNVHVCNNLRLMTDFAERPTRVGKFTLDGIFPGRGTVRIRLVSEDGSEGIILNFRNVFYIPNSPSNLISLSLLNDVSIDYNNKQQALYDKASRKLFAFAQRWELSFLLHPLNLFVSSANFLKVKDDRYHDTGPKVHQTQSEKHPLTIWHQWLGHLNFPVLRKHLTHHMIRCNNNERVCNSCEKEKATKQ